MLSTLGFIALLIGIILLVCGYTVSPPALRPGWALTILGVVLVLLAFLLPALHPAYA